MLLVQDLRTYLGLDGVPDEEVQQAIDDTERIISEKFPDYSENDYAKRLYASYLLQRSGKVGTLTSISNEGISSDYAAGVSFSNSNFFDLFYNYVENKVKVYP